MTKSPIKSGEVDANDRVRLAVKSQAVELRKKTAEFEIMLEDIRKPNHRMFRHIKSQFHSGGFHVRTTRPKETRLEASVERLVIRSGSSLNAGELFAQAFSEFGGKQISTCFPCNHHEALRFQLS